MLSLNIIFAVLASLVLYSSYALQLYYYFDEMQILPYVLEIWQRQTTEFNRSSIRFGDVSRGDDSGDTQAPALLFMPM